jgi:tetrapyrrole methylase family protein/MazG family protein/ATP diphosphatase
MKPIDRLVEIMAQLRDKEKGCPWDIEQTFATIIPHTLEEAYEVADAVEKNDMRSLREELGDLLLQVVFHAQMATEQKLFSFDDVAQAISDKLVSRHPHVFGDAKVNTAAEQTEAWEKHKDAEKKKASSGHASSVLADVPLALPSLSRALKLQKRAARTGFDWPNLEAVFDKLEEEIEELVEVVAQEGKQEEKLEEVGDVLFSCVNLSRKLGVDPEEALRACNRKFETRFRYIELELDSQQRDIKEASLQELNDLWDQAKIAEKAAIK